VHFLAGGRGGLGDIFYIVKDVETGGWQTGPQEIHITTWCSYDMTDPLETESTN
jgi:hypothetical protein